jgi:hypothetical protein
MAAPPQVVSCDPDLKRLFMTHQMPANEVDEVAKVLHEEVGVMTVHHYLGYFAQVPIIDFWKSQIGWKTRGALLAYLRSAFLALQEAESNTKEKEKSMLDSTLNNPIDPQTNKSLSSTWLELYGYALHPTMEANHQILGSMWRHLLTRQLRAEEVRGLHTLESTSGIEPGKKQFTIGDLRLVTEEDRKGKEVQYRHNSNPFLFICCLEVMLRTLCKAGTFWCDDPEDDRTPEEIRVRPKRLMIERDPIEQHLAQCRAFTIEWSTKQHPPSTGAITRQMARIDLEIRKRWCKLFRENKPENRTFNTCIKETRSTADALWTADLSREMTTANPKGGGKGTLKVARSALAGAQKGSRKGSGKTTHKGGSNKSNQSKGGGKGSLVIGSNIKVKNKMAKSARSRGSKNFCIFYNAKGNCNKGDQCAMAHQCNLLTADNRVCEGNHPAMKHPGDFMVARN